MADKAQNITINYKFNTAEVDRAGAVLNRVNQINNNLQQSGEKTGQAISNSFRAAIPSITSMQNQLARLRTQIEVSSNPKRVEELTNQYKQLKTQLDATTKSAFNVAQAQKQTAQQTQSLTQQFGGLFTAVKTFIAAGAVKQFFDLSIEAASLAGNVEGVSKAFNRTFPNAKQLLDELKRATHGTVGELELMQQTLQAKNLGIPVKDLGTFFQFAATRAQQTGVSVQYLTDSIVNGLGRKSTRVLDNLGISATRIKDEFHGVSLEQLSVAEVSEGVARIIQQEMGKMGDYVETAATKVENLAVSWQHFKEVASEALSGEGGVTGLLKDYLDTFALAIEANNKDISVQDLANQKRIESIALISEREYATRVLTGTQEENIKSIESEIGELTKELGQWAAMRSIHQERIDSLNDENKALGDKLNKQEVTREEARREFLQIKDLLALETKLRDSRKEDIGIDQEILKLLQGRLAALKQVNEEEDKEPSGIISRKKAEIEALEKQIELTNNLNDLGRARAVDPNNPDDTRVRSAGRLVVKLEILKAELSDLQRVFNDFKPVKFDSVLGVTEIDKAIAAYDKLDTSVKKSLQNIAKSLESTAGTTRDLNAQADLEIGKIISNELNRPQRPNNTVVDFSFLDKLKESFEDNWQSILSAGIDIQADALKSIAQQEIDNLNLRLQNIQKFYESQQLLAGDNQRYQQELRVKEDRETTKLRNDLARKEKNAKRAQLIIDVAAGVGKAFATYAWPYSLIVAGLVAGAGAVQLNTLNKQPNSFAKGVIDLQGPGTETSDSIPAKLSKHESVMTAWETKNAGDVLKAVRARKLDNRILRDLNDSRRGTMVSTNNFDDTALLKAIAANKPPDVVEQSNLVYNSRTYNEDYIRKVRNKSVRI